MIKVIGVRFRQAGKVYFFDPMNMKIEKGQHVIVETARGVEYGNVVLGIREVEDDKVVLPLKPVIRIATAEDDKKEEANRKKEKEAYKICLEKIAKHKLEMKLIDVEYTFDNNKVLFYFTADGRIDFRELVKDLAAVFRTRIELRQIGVRDETKIRGGIGICGRVLCCQTGTSNGEKWSKELYDETVEFYGREFLARYIVNGEFLRDKVNSDIENYQMNAEAEYEEALQAYTTAMLKAAKHKIVGQNVACEISSNGNYLILYPTEEQFASLSFENSTEWFFGLEVKNSDAGQDLIVTE